MKTVAAGGWIVGQVNLVSVEDIIPTPDNNRVIQTDSPGFRELVASIRQVGVLQNLVGRPHPVDPNTIDLRAGARRYAAAREAGLTVVPVAVLALTDKEAMEITMVENLHREQLTPLEEANAIRKMLLAGYTEKEIAGKIDKPWSWVVRRNRLNELSPLWLAEMTKPSAMNMFAHFQAAHLELLARYPTGTQDQLLATWNESMWNIPKTAADMADQLAHEERALGDVPWDLTDCELVPRAGSCRSCTKRSNCVPGLFDDQEEPLDKDDRCLDEKCFEKKLKAHVDRQVEKTQADHPNAVLVSATYNSRKGVIASYNWGKAKKSDKEAKPAVLVDGPQAGELVYVKLKRAEAEPKENAAEQARNTFIREALEKALGEVERPEWFTALVALRSHDLGIDALMEAKSSKLPEAKTLDDAWDTLRDSMCETIRWQGDVTADVEKFMGKHLGINAAKIRHEARALHPDEPGTDPEPAPKPKTKSKGKKKA